MLQLNFNSIYETEPGDKWKALFNKHWPAYKAWFQSKGAFNNPDLKTSKAQLESFMPELVPTYNRLCELAGNDPVAERFLTGYQPPAYITGCSQAIWKRKLQLVRNYDYHPNLSEGTLLNSAWNGKHVIAIGDCLMGVVDGMNSDGLVASLTFGGRKVVGKGFGIPFILRYVLEFCSDVEQAVEALKRIPTHMAYNIMVLDITGTHKMLQLAPDHDPVVTDLEVSTNHQGQVDWPEHAKFSRTIERERFLNELLQEPNQNEEAIAEAFLRSPLFNTRYNDGFGTVYTALYRPKDGYMELRWQEKRIRQSFADFKEGNTLITYTDRVITPPVYAGENFEVNDYHSKEADYWIEYGKSWAPGKSPDLALTVTNAICDGLGITGTASTQKILEEITSQTKKRGQIPWELLVDVMSKLGNRYEK